MTDMEAVFRQYLDGDLDRDQLAQELIADLESREPSREVVADALGLHPDHRGVSQTLILRSTEAIQQHLADQLGVDKNDPEALKATAEAFDQLRKDTAGRNNDPEGSDG